MACGSRFALALNASIACSMAPIPSLAQSTLDGTWEVEFSTRDTEIRQAEVRIAGATGTWTTAAQAGKERKDPCVGRPFPLAVVEGGPGRIVLQVSFEKEMRGCKDRTVTGELKDGKTIEGKLENGKPLRMVRKSGS